MCRVFCPVRQQPCITRNLGIMKLQLQTAVKTDSQRPILRFTHWIPCCFVLSPSEHPLSIGLNDTGRSQDDLAKWEIRVKDTICSNYSNTSCPPSLEWVWREIVRLDAGGAALVYLLLRRGRSSVGSERRPVTPEVASSNLVAPASNFKGLRFILDPFIVVW